MAAITDLLHRVLLPRALDTTTTTTISTQPGGGIPLWALIVVVIGGTVILVTALVLPLTILRRWRRRRNRQGGRRKRVLAIDGREVSVYRGSGGGNGGMGSGDTSTETLEKTGKLRKKKKRAKSRSPDVGSWESSSSGEEGDGAGNRLGSHLSLPPVLPMIRRASSGFLSAATLASLNRTLRLQQQGQVDDGGETMSGAMGMTDNDNNNNNAQQQQQQQRSSLGPHRRRTSNAWVDEDAIHGPPMNIGSPRKNKSKAGKVGRLFMGRKGRESRRSWRRSLRESWHISPTLPKLASFGSFGSGNSPKVETNPNLNNGHTDSGDELPMRPPMVHGTSPSAVFRSQHHRLGSFHIPRLLPSPGVHELHGVVTPQYSPPRQLPKPPRQALPAANIEAAGAGFAGGTGRLRRGSISPGSGPVGGYTVPRDRGPSYWVYEDDNSSTGDLNRAVVPAPLRLSTGSATAPRRGPQSSDSSLTYILRGTERRLVDGGIGGSKRGLAPSAVVIGGRTRSGTLSIGGESNLTLVGSGTATPSPPKPTANSRRSMAAHQNTTVSKHGSYRDSRDDARDSIQSDDSFALGAREPSPEGGYFQGLSSPNKGSPPRQQETTQRLRQEPIDSPNSGELSDLAEEDENTPPRNTVAKLAAALDHRNNNTKNEDDPFVTLHDSRARRVQPISRNVHAFNDAPLLQAGPGPSRNSEITRSLLRSDSPLSNISGNSRRNSPDFRGSWRRSTSPEHAHNSSGTAKVQTTLREIQHQLMMTPEGSTAVYAQPAVPTSAVSSTANILLHQHRRSLSTVTDNEDEAPSTSPRHGRNGGSPTPKRLSQLRAQASSPTLGRSLTPEMPPPSAALPPMPPRVASSYYEACVDDGRRMSALGVASLSQKTSPSEVASSHFTDFEREKLAALGGNSPLTELIQGGGGDGRGRRRSQTIRLVPPESMNISGGVLPLVAELRRMNSQVSGHNSDGGSSSGASTSANTPLLPTLREEGTGRFVRPPRQREASRNYLGLERASNRAVSGSAAAFTGGHGDLRYQRHHQDKENVRRVDDGTGLKPPRADFGGGENPVAGGATWQSRRVSGLPRWSQKAAERSSERESDEGEYDPQGFWRESS